MKAQANILIRLGWRKTCLFALCLVFFVVALPGGAYAQNWGAWVAVPIGECACRDCSVSTYAPPGCTLTVTCQRRDDAIQSMTGPEVVESSDPVDCEYCPICCDSPPCSCVGLPSMIVCGLAELRLEDVIEELSVNPCLNLTDKALLQQLLLDATGFTGQSVHHCCDADASLCTETLTVAKLTKFEGSLATRNHEWRVVRVYGGFGCNLAGTYFTSCGTGTSTVKATVVNIAGADCFQDIKNCGPACP